MLSIYSGVDRRSDLMTISFIVYLLPFGETQTFRFLLVLRGAAIAIADKKG
ncbi:hypothetical protein VL20_4565 [Microcystis panniformis FACHB-1757]|uniref:Uncharacterized protein n=1 Tax=Microcystis panniformis FACHB-1757 TaxID=1638788 RepID=A0A0K1S630_9CHRO|nr:hypothetical protein VL20_4565 [Microcystis panniformis FACHB-1757]